MTDVREFDAAYHLDNPEVIAAYLEEAFETGDKAYIAHAFRTVARARGMDELAESLGMSRSGLYKALGPEGNPSFDTMLRLLTSLGMGVSVHPQRRPAPPDMRRLAPPELLWRGRKTAKISLMGVAPPKAMKKGARKAMKGARKDVKMRAAVKRR